LTLSNPVLKAPKASAIETIHDEALSNFAFKFNLRRYRERGKYCHNDSCTVMGPLKNFKQCPLCKFARYCGKAWGLLISY
jgi:hypothetical protein